MKTCIKQQENIKSKLQKMYEKAMNRNQKGVE